VQRTPLMDFDITRLAVVQSPGVPSSTKSLPSYFPAAKTLSVTPSTLAGQPYPTWNGGDAAPYVYFSANSYGTMPILPSTQAYPTGFNLSTTALPFPNAGTATPYWNDLNGNGLTLSGGVIDPNENYANPDSFQIISAGLDGKYGKLYSTPGTTIPVRAYPTGGSTGNYDTSGDQADDDNVTNFCNKPRLGDAKP